MTNGLKEMIKTLISKNFDDVDGVYDLFMKSKYTPSMTIGDVIEWINETELRKCDRCGEWEYQDNMITTETRLGGGIGMICRSCEGDM